MNRYCTEKFFLRFLRSFAVKKTAVVCVFLCAVSAHAQQAGGVRGVVYDSDFDAPVAGAEILIAETGEKATTTGEGNYVFSQIEPGTYTLVVSKEGYTRKVFADVVVPAGQMTDVDASLAGEFTDMEEFVVQDLNLGGATEEGLLNLRAEAPALMDSVSSDLMSQAGASDAAAALNLVSGATVQDGKYAVIRGLPDRYVNSQMNGVRLPSADPDKRAVQLDQFPSALIESIQVSKTFTPDQQGDASGGAVNVVLKKIPDEPVLKFKVGTEFNTQVMDNDDGFLSYKGGGVNTWGNDRGGRDVQPVETDWDGAVGATRTDAPMPYNWQLTAGGKKDLFKEVKVGGLANFYYKRKASHYDGGVDDAYWVKDSFTPSFRMTPQFSGVTPKTPTDPTDNFKTDLFDISQSSEEVQWGGLGSVGMEGYGQSLNLLYMRTQVTEDKVTVAEDTRGKEYFVTSQVPGYDPFALSDDYREAAPYQRFQTMEYTERKTETLQLSGDHTIPFPDFLEIPHVIKVLDPELDWTLSESSSSLYSPDKRMFGTLWRPGTPDRYYAGFPPWVPAQTIPGLPEGYEPNKTTANASLGGLQRVWKEVVEESEQYSINLKLPFEQWTGDKGYLKYGVFNDVVERTYRQDSFSNFQHPPGHVTGNSDTGPHLPWETPWSDIFPDEYHEIRAANIDVDYDGRQEINAWYYMADIPFCSWFKVIGGVRRETTKMNITLDPDPPDPGGVGSVFVPNGLGGVMDLEPGMADVDFKEVDDLPSIAFEFQPIEQIVFRGSFNETVARQTFKELTPILQSEYLGADVFIGNPNLEMSDVENYDLRLDLTPLQGSLISFSWFKKRIKNPIEYVQDGNDAIGAYTTAVNYPYGEMSGYELELRQQLGSLWGPLEGFSVGGNGTLINSKVRMAEEDVAYMTEQYGIMDTSRDMLNAPEHLYNLFASCDIGKTGTRLGIFYTVKGDTLVTGAGQSTGKYVPSVYAKEYETLNFSLSQKIGDHFTLTFKAKNLLDPAIQEVYRDDRMDGDVVKTSYTKGIDYSISLGGEF